MRFKTLVLIPAIAVLAASAASLPVAQNQTSANEAPQKVRLIVRTVDKEQERENAASRSAQRFAYASPKYNKKYAKSYISSKYKWNNKQYNCLVSLWNKESGWRVNADNPNSSAYGIPQALPGKKMASAGPNWKTNPHTQIKWGVKYIKSRYKTPCGAWAAFNKKGWY
jgi:hypothetical protein